MHSIVAAALIQIIVEYFMAIVAAVHVVTVAMHLVTTPLADRGGR